MLNLLQALSTPDIPEAVPHIPGTVRGRKWMPPPKPEPQNPLLDESIELDIDLGEEYEEALASASTSEIVDLVRKHIQRTYSGMPKSGKH